MGKAELAANLFRVSQTDEKIKNEGISGQRALEKTAKTVGTTVRETMHKLNNVYPEDLPVSSNIRSVRTSLKQANRQFPQLDVPAPTERGSRS